VIGRDFIGRASPSEQGPLWVACPSLPPPSPPCASPPGQLAEVGQGCPEAGRAAPRMAELPRESSGAGQACSWQSWPTLGGKSRLGLHTGAADRIRR
jgi:hypothetical protein